MKLEQLITPTIHHDWEFGGGSSSSDYRRTNADAKSIDIHVIHDALNEYRRFVEQRPEPTRTNYLEQQRILAPIAGTGLAKKHIVEDGRSQRIDDIEFELRKHHTTYAFVHAVAGGALKKTKELYAMTADGLGININNLPETAKVNAERLVGSVYDRRATNKYTTGHDLGRLLQEDGVLFQGPDNKKHKLAQALKPGEHYTHTFFEYVESRAIKPAKKSYAVTNTGRIISYPQAQETATADRLAALREEHPQAIGQIGTKHEPVILADGTIISTDKYTTT